VRKAAEGKGHMFETFIAAVRDGVTEGEITGVLREVFGTYRERVF
jgi:methylmalonyl-CoA mutase N-terminal domain/subunit